ncbi:MAG: proton-conducting transporter membrane subunit [Planctomycetota bacterium]
MNLTTLLPTLLGTAWLLPLASFVLIVFFGKRMGHGGKAAGFLATGAIASGFVLSLSALICWLSVNPLTTSHAGPPHPISGDWYTLGQFGSLSLTIGYYIDSLTLAMFCMVTLIASCIHIYSLGYMHEELHEVTDSLARLENGEPLRRRGRFYRFFQYLSLFCFSMLGLVIAGNLAMVFAFWELVGICSYLLIGFYIERKSASNAANKAFIVNRVGDFGMIIGLMAIFAGMGTFSFGDHTQPDGTVQPGVFSQVRPERDHFEPHVPDGMVFLAAQDKVSELVHGGFIQELEQRNVGGKPRLWNGKLAFFQGHYDWGDWASKIEDWREQGYGYWLLVVAGLGIFCGCVGKSAQFPLHVWLPDAMEGPTPVSALIHAATMVAAGVYLVGRCYPIFTPEVLLVIAIVGTITLFIAATIAITATDIKRVLAYSTVSQLGYMMLALGLGGWLAGMFHLFTHAFFKALLFLCSGSVIHATGTNEMPQMGGLRKKMPWTAGTMLVGCLAIAGAGIPLVVGLSGYYSKDGILAQALLFKQFNPLHGYFFWIATGGAAITTFYMFRLWYMTFAGEPRDKHVYQHAHESPRAMVGPLVVLAFFAVVAGWTLTPLGNFGLTPLLEQARPLGTEHGASAGWSAPVVKYPSEHESHAEGIHVPATFWAFGSALAGFVLATVFYGLRKLNPDDVRKQFAPIYRFLIHKWWFDELYALLFIRPALRISNWVAAWDKQGIDRAVDGLVWLVGIVARLDEWIDRIFVDGLVNGLAHVTHAAGLRLRTVQSGNLRQYVLWMAVGTVALFLLISFYWNWALVGT